MKNFTLLLFLMLATVQITWSQRYYDEIFTDYELTENVIYGFNATLAPVFFQGGTEAVPRPLNMDIYQPMGDTETDRPLVILLHTGNFLPPQVNGGCGGTIKDNDMVNFANKLTKRGYVVAVADYRIGWNPIDPSQNNRVNFLINAAYRGVQDARTCVRYFKKDVAEGGNTYGIDPDKIVMWGFGTGGYIAYAAATLDAVEDTYIPKFFTTAGTPMIVESINGNVHGTNVGVLPVDLPPLSAGDTLCYPNHVGYSSDFQLGISAGGALGDTSWIDANDPPYISYHVTTDPFAPCGTGTVIVPPPASLPVVTVQGGCVALPTMFGEGVNQAFVDAQLSDPLTAYVNSVNGGIEGFYPMFSNDPEESAPWNFHLVSEPYGVEGSDCDTDMASSQIVVDSMLTYFAPRACVALGLYENCSAPTSVRPIDAEQVGLNMLPNPAQIEVYFEAKENIESIHVYDITGRLVKAHVDIDHTNFTMPRHNMANGMYIAKVRFKEGFVTKKLVLN